MEGIGIKNLEQALARFVEIGVDAGKATAGTNTTLTDTTKNWEVNRWVPGDIHVIIAGTEYVRTIASNIANQITFAALPGVTAPVAGDAYSIRQWAGLTVMLLLTSVQNIETIANLGIGGVFTGASRDCEEYGDFCVSCFADQLGTLFVENSRDGAIWRTHDTVAIAINTPVNRVYAVTMRYNRVRYLNGAVVQTAFELVTLQRPIGG